MNAYSRPLP
jgi:hypothetical protein